MQTRVRTKIAVLITTVLALVVPFLTTGAGTATAQTAPPLELTAAGPIYAQAGGTIDYELTVKNTTGRTVRNVEFFNDLPENTTHVSGGEFIADTPPYTQFTLASIAPNATQKVRWTARVDPGVEVDTIITNTAFGFNDGAKGDAFGDVLTKIEAPSTVEAVFRNDDGTAFDVTQHGYGFQNYGGEPNLDPSDDLTAIDLFALFGPDVCKSGNTAQTCVLKAAATKWRDAQLASMSGGHCEGMAATSLRIFEELPYRGQSGAPSRFQSGAARAFDLSIPNNTIENYIAHYFVTQSVGDYYYDESREIVRSANDLISILTENWNGPNPTAYTMGIYRLDADGEFQDGHAIAVYAVEKVSDSESRLVVYDNNFPGLRQYITVDTAANTWRYETSATPGEEGAVYSGNATSGNLSIHDNDSRDLPAGTYNECEFCQGSAGAAASTSSADASTSSAALAAIGDPSDLVFEYSGEGGMVVIDEADNRSGGDFESDDFLRQIPGTTVEPFKGGLGLDIPPTIRIPQPEGNLEDYSVIVHGRNTGAATGGDLSITGPGFVIGVNGIELNAGEIFEFVLDHEGRSMAFAASEPIEAPEVFISYDPVSEEDPSVVFDIEGVELNAGEDAQIELDPDLERVFFSHSGPQAEEFVIDMQLIWPDGDVQTFEEDIVTPAGTNEAFLDFGSWDGLGRPPIYIDGVLTNPTIEHRLALVDMDTTFRPEAADGAPSGVYDITATFENVTEVSLEDVSFVLDELDDEDTLQNAGAASRLDVPDAALGDGLLDPNETFEFTFSIGLGDSSFGGAVFGAEGVPFDWSIPDVAPSYEANDGPFVFAAAQTRGIGANPPAPPVQTSTPASPVQAQTPGATPVSPRGPLALTGAQTDLLVPIAGMLLVLGAMFVLISRRRQTTLGFAAPAAHVGHAEVPRTEDAAPTMFIARTMAPAAVPAETPAVIDEPRETISLAAEPAVAPDVGAIVVAPQPARRPARRSATGPVLAVVAVVSVVAALRWRHR